MAMKEGYVHSDTDDTWITASQQCALL